MRQLRSEDCRLQLVKARVSPFYDTHIPFVNATMAQQTQACCQLRIVRNHCPAVAICAEILRRIEAEGA